MDSDLASVKDAILQARKRLKGKPSGHYKRGWLDALTYLEIIIKHIEDGELSDVELTGGEQ